ncbi:MAG: hypothetical protein V3575_03045 [Candidatus Absconditabacteria bacterium]
MIGNRKKFIEGIAQGAGLVTFLVASSLVYGTWNNISSVSDGQTLQASTLNNIINGLNLIDEKQLPTSWAYFDGSTCSTTCVIYDSYNIDRIEKVASGKYNVYFSTPMNNINYAFMVGSTDESDHASLSRWMNPLIRETNYVQILTEYVDGRNLDHANISFSTYGGK